MRRFIQQKKNSLIPKIILLACLLTNFSFSQEKQRKTSLRTTFLGTYIDGEVKLNLDEQQAAPTVCTWNEQGDFLSSERLDSIGGSPFDAFVYTYNTDGTTASYINCNGDRSEIWTLVKYEYDAKGRKHKEFFCNANSTCNSYWLYAYDDFNNVISETLYKHDQIQRKHSIQISYNDTIVLEKEIKEFQNDRLVVHKIEKYENNLLTRSEDKMQGSIWSYTYNEDKTLKTETANFGHGETTYFNYYEYDEFNNPTLKVNCDESEFGLIETITYQYF